MTCWENLWAITPSTIIILWFAAKGSRYGSLVPRLPNLFNVHEKEGEPGIKSHVTNVTPYTKVGRVQGHDNWAWVSYIFKRSSSTWIEDMVPKPSSKCSRIFEGLKELFDELKLAYRYEINTTSLSWHHVNIYHMRLIPATPLLPLVLLCTLKRLGSLGARLQIQYIWHHYCHLWEFK